VLRLETLVAGLPQRARVRIEAREPQPAIPDEPFDRGVVPHHPFHAIARRLDDDRESRRFVDFHHLPRQPGSQIALRAVHHAEQ